MVASSVPAILPLPTTSAEATTQAVAATTLALRAHDRVQVALHGETLDGHLLCTSLLRSIREELPRTRLFVDGVAAARAWARHSPSSPCDVLGAGDVANDDEAVLIVAPTNRAPTWRRERAPRTPESPVEPDALKLKSFQALVARAGSRPVVLVNADLEALTLTAPRVGRPIRPMLLSDFEMAYYLATSPRQVDGDVFAVRRAFPCEEWETWAHAPREAAKMLRRTTPQRPAAADVVARRARPVSWFD